MKLRGFLGFFLLLNLMQAQNPEVSILKSLNSGNMPCWDKTMRGVSFSVYGTMPATPIGIWTQGYITKDPVMMRNGYKSAACIGIALATSTSLKYLVNRQRPFVKYPNDITQRDPHVGPFSFPSGHTTSAFATATALTLTYKKWYVAVPSYAYAGLVGYSRMRLGVHYPSDVFGGIIVGVGAGFLTWGLDKAINRK
jgi:undecaprenyl-diphosphatase